MIGKSTVFMIFSAMVLISCNGGSEPSTTVETKKNETVKDEQTYPERDFGDLLVELESNVGWNAVAGGWKSRREDWVMECFSAEDIATKANLLMEFETYLEWKAVDPLWAKRREGWIADLKTSTNDADLGKYLTELEGYIIWDVVSPDWVNLRDSWIEACKNLSEGEW